jgi:serine/threonine protein kinase
MVQCPKCSAQNLPDSRFCSSCAQPLSTPSQMPTMEAPAAQSPHVARIISSDSVPAGGFTPGTILADRYRIIGLLGRGGMGEVYRADDLKLGQPVALKFLPSRLAEDPVRRERFFAEVRITRQLSHPNICRVYDIGEIDGHHFLSMEFIDGEDLASLLKRIGHLTNEKALDIARQLAAGLAAAHERGVLHRDLKPANIMLDGHGRVRITDFGLAIAADEAADVVEIAGTPAYMAPEQLAGKGSTVRSDMYSLGLVLYEIYTGKKAFTATNLAELRQQKETHTPRAISELREGMDPVVERLIRRCMERDPNARPASVAQLALALPGGDPLAAAIAAGETPSPELVAASGSKEGFRPAVAWSILALIIAGVFASIWIYDRILPYRRIPFENSPEVLADRARQFLLKAGYAEKPVESNFGFVQNDALLQYIQNNNKTAGQWKNLDDATIIFWYRQSARHTRDQDFSPLAGRQDTSVLTQLEFLGDIFVKLDTRGRLLSLRAVPPPGQPKSGSVGQPDWTLLFSAAGLDISQWSPQTAVQWNPIIFADAIAAWQRSIPNHPEVPVQIQAAALHGRPVSFEIIGPWTQSADEVLPQRVLQFIFLGLALIFVLALCGGLCLVWRNLRMGRGDRRSANRLGIFIVISTGLSQILTWSESGGVGGLLLVPWFGGLAWILYLAVEPFVRRRWPQMLVSWTKLLSGNWRDPLVARDVLAGCAVVICGKALQYFLGWVAPKWFGYAIPGSVSFIRLSLNGIMGTRFVISRLLGNVFEVVISGLCAILLLVIAKVLLKSQKVAAFVIIITFAVISMPQTLWSWGGCLIFGILMFVTITRFGLVGCSFGLFATYLLSRSPATLETSAWYAPYGYAALVFLAAIVLLAFRYSLGGRPLLAPSHLDE